MCCLRFDTSFSIRLTAKPHTGFGKKAYTERGAANAILIFKGLQMKNEESRIHKWLGLGIRNIHKTPWKSVKEFGRNRARGR